MINPIQDHLRGALNDPNLTVETEVSGDFLVLSVVSGDKKIKYSATLSNPHASKRGLSQSQVEFINDAAFTYFNEHIKADKDAN